MALTGTTLLLAAALVYSAASDTDCPIPENSIYEPSSFQKCIYNSKNGKTTYDSGELFCKSANGHLLKINNAYENSLAVSFLYEENGSSGQNVRLGLRKTNNMWKWSDGTDATYLRFGAGNPKSGVNCVTLNTTDLLWYSTDCQVQSPFSCLFPTLNNTKPSPPQNGGSCRPGWNYFAETNMCYFVGRNASYYAAEDVCALLGASLASVHSLRESNFIAGLTLSVSGACVTSPFNSYRTWIGGYYSDQWRWTDGTNFDFDNTDSVTQKSGSLAIVSNSYCPSFGRWTNYSPPSQFAYFVCKTPALKYDQC